MSTHDDEPDGAHTHVLLLRGVNIGGRNRTPKAELAALAERAGAREVTVYLNSGNVLCRMPGEEDSAAGVAERLRRLLAERLGVDTSVHVAAREELSGLLDVLAGSELCGADEGLDELDPKRVHLVLFGRAPMPTPRLRCRSPRSRPRASARTAASSPVAACGSAMRRSPGPRG